MIDRHTIINDNDEEILVLFLNYNYEISSVKHKKTSFIDNMKNYISNKHIKFNGNKIILVIMGVIIGTVIYTNSGINFKPTTSNINYSNNNIIYTLNDKPILENNIKKENIEVKTDKQTDKNIKSNTESTKKSVLNKNNEQKTNINISTNNTNNVSNDISVSNKNENIQEEKADNKEIVTIYRKNGQILNLELEEYVIGVVAAEMPASFNIEALKAQAVLARTYALKSKKTGKKLTDTVSTQEYIDIDQMKSKWGSDFSKYYNKIKEAVLSTKGVVAKYNNEYIDAVYHSTSNGYTEDALEVWGYSIPYLKSVESKWDISASSYLRTVSIDIDSILKTFNIASLDEFNIIKKDNSGRVSSVKINNEVYSGKDIRELLGLRSTDFEIEIDNNNIKFTTKGYGHGVGMSQYGSNGMAKEGYTYDQILKYYYNNISLS